MWLRQAPQVWNGRCGSGGINGERSGTTPVQGSSLTSLPVDSSSVGPQSGTIFLDSPVEGTGGLGAYPVNWTCVRPAQASLSGETHVPGGVVSASFEVSPEPVVVEIDVWNFGFDSLQSRLFVDGLLAPPASPILEVLQVPNNLGTGPAQIRLLVDASQAGDFTNGLVFKPEMKTFLAKLRASSVFPLNCRLDQQFRVTSMATDW